MKRKRVDITIDSELLERAKALIQERKFSSTMESLLREYLDKIVPKESTKEPKQELKESTISKSDSLDIF